ncbi:histidine phosphatase family protein [Marinitenerispora sediminis]|uniref:Histidine phosphatase family protein n=1 Tax=Marinitenerispora sediminis TaxID=1931232 RepID=A0A368T4Y1_9ACTN|nr:histidine phosphatase family protein [Marinitenerispora sediminis]RCV52400.1 histidine phosphatase family protein [Marinitenerispora sediminis]RCV53895.1 histidine phosphatase family protein [Marinitenerispora sediminis]RCV58607.1 histidine phosphatase family protein [Marinitenerispora sediminis]
MTESRRVVCWRHGQTTWNVEKRFQGQTDIPLNDTGRAQAEHAARLLSALRPDAIAASDLRRAADTAAALSRRTGLPVEHDKGLRERTGGLWEGLTGAEIRERWPEEHARWEIPDGEDMAAVAERVAEAILRHLARVPEGGVLVVASHGAALRAGIGHLLGLPAEHRDVLGPLDNCAWSVLGPRRAGGWRLLEHNAGTLPQESQLSDDR